MNKEKAGAGVSQANVPGVPQNASGVPVKRLRSSRRWIVIICGILVVVVVALISLAIVGGKHFGSSSNYRPNSPEDIMVRYLHDKYGKDFKLVGEMRRTHGVSAPRRNYYESDAYPVDNPHLRFEVVLNGRNREHGYNKSDTYAKVRQISAEEDRLQPYAERIFGKNTKVGVEFRLCERGAASMKGMVGLPEAMSICKEETGVIYRMSIRFIVMLPQSGRPKGGAPYLACQYEVLAIFVIQVTRHDVSRCIGSRLIITTTYVPERAPGCFDDNSHYHTDQYNRHEDTDDQPLAFTMTLRLF